MTYWSLQEYLLVMGVAYCVLYHNCLFRYSKSFIFSFKLILLSYAFMFDSSHNNIIILKHLIIPFPSPYSTKASFHPFACFFSKIDNSPKLLGCCRFLSVLNA
jgi:hypothetical protein